MKFILVNAMPSSPDSASPSAQPGTTATTGTTEAAGATAASSGSGQTYRLVANPTALAPHVGKKVELTGTIDESASAQTSTTTSGDPSASAPQLRVEAGKVLTAPCSQ